MKILEATAKNPTPAPAMGEAAPDFEVVVDFPDCADAPVGGEVTVPVGADELDEAVEYIRELVYVMHDEVAGITGAAPGGAWLSPRHEVNWLGAYEAGMLNAHP